jgi:NAD(P)-dependent dehydrogenase (short-subunit alcohol dehydrogenase family)
MSTKIAKHFMIPAGRGRIIFISSTAAHFGVPEAVAYGVSKASTLQMTKALAAEWAKYNIHVNAVNPFFVATDLIAFFDEKTVESIAQKSPLKRIANPEDIVGGVLFLCSDLANYITGVHLDVDGGRTIAGS